MDQEKFGEYIDELYIQNKDSKIALLMDNFTAHKSKDTVQKMDELDIPAIFNVPY